MYPWGQMEYLDFGQMAAQFREVFLEGSYCFHSENPEPCIIDCGGNIGMSAVWFKLAYPKCKLTVYEADPAIADILKRNIAQAKLDQVTVRNTAVWSCETSLQFDNRGNDSGRICEAGTLTVPAVDIVKELPAEVDLLKLDIEGAEYAVLDHLCDTGAIERIQAVVAEFHVWCDRIDDALCILTKLRAAGMDISLSSLPCPWIGSAASSAPFKVIGENQMLMMVYAWRPLRHGKLTEEQRVSNSSHGLSSVSASSLRRRHLKSADGTTAG